MRNESITHYSSLSFVWWELHRLARRGHAAVARIILLYALLLTLIAFAFVWGYQLNPVDPFAILKGTAEPIPRDRIAELLTRWLRWLVFVLLEVQLLLVATLTPAYTAAAIAEEKERRTLPLLLSTALTDREILWGKALARVVLILAAVAAGLPVLLFMCLLGGVDIEFLAAGYALTVGTVLLSAGIGLSAACHAPDSRSALMRAYGQSVFLVGMIPPFALLSPFAMLALYFFELETGVLQVAFGFGYPVGQAAIACVLMIEAARGLRKPASTVEPPPPSEFPEPPRGRPVPIVFGSPDAEPPPLPPIDDADPVLWKERHAGRTLPMPVLEKPTRMLAIVAAVFAVALFVGGGWTLVKRAVRALDPDVATQLVRREVGESDRAGMFLLLAGVVAAGLYVLPLAIGVTGCIAGERFRGTLDSLLATPLDREKILRSKVRAHTERGLSFAGVAAAAFGAAFGADGGVWLGLAALLAFVASVGLVVGFAAWLSVRCETPGRAFRFSWLAVGLAMSLPVLVWIVTDWANPGGSVQVFLYAAGVFGLGGAGFWWRAEAELRLVRV